jgi:signal transduction histidine kinase
MYITNQDFIIEYQNEIFKNLFGNNIGKRCCAAFGQSDETCNFCYAHESFQSGKISQVEAILSNGRNYDMIFSPFTDVDEEIKTIVLLRDVTEKKKLQAETMRVGHLASLGELAAGVAHEINNPINGIINYAEIMQDQSEENGEDADIPARIVKEGDRIARIVNNLLSFARGRSEEYSPVRVQDILADALGLAKQQIVKDGIKLSVDFPPDLPEVRARSQEIQQVFLNILSNARYALNQRFPELHEGKILAIRGDTTTLAGRGYVRTIFHDDGTGIPENIIDKISHPFFTTKPRGEGTGLGLSIIHGIIKNHQGKLFFDSVEGSYTTVTVDLPVHQ